MNENNYRTIEVKLGNYIRRFEMRETYIGTIAFENKLFNVIGSSHSLDMLQERGIDKYHVLGSIIALGRKLIEYNNNDKHIMISDEKKNISTVFTIENYIIVLITVIDKGKEVYISNNTVKETIYENYGDTG
jgi:predicted KAP-like P-loop ATPase